MDYNCEKYCVARLRGDNTHIIKPFDKLDDAIDYAKSLMDEWDYWMGLPCITIRHSVQNPDEWKKMGLKPYRDEIVWCEFDIEKVEEVNRIRITRKNNQRKKLNRKLKKGAKDGDMETNTGI